MFGMATRRTSPRRGSLRYSLGFVAASAVASLASPASAGGLTTLYAYCAQPACADGSQPKAAMIMDSAGYLYGTTFTGGDSGGVDAGYGTVFRRRGSHAPQILLTFCANCAAGTNPLGRLVMDVNGHLYGTASAGGAHGQGTVFELVPNDKRTRWRVGHLYGFCAQAGCADGSNPFAGLTYKGAETGALYDGVSPLYGTTLSGGLKSSGTVFQVVPADHGRFREKVLYSFCLQDGCTDGANPGAALLTDSAGNLYGTTRAGGAGVGVVFELKQTRKGYVETVLHAFGTSGDGATPEGALVWDGANNLVGVAQQGGAKGSGAVFRVTPSGVNSLESLLYSFCQQTNCIDGDQPRDGVVVGANGDLFGVTRNGGSQGLGVAYRLTGSSETVVYNFCAQAGFCPDGSHPEAGLVADGTGGFFGTTVQGGIHGGGGIVFRLTP